MQTATRTNRPSQIIIAFLALFAVGLFSQRTVAAPPPPMAGVHWVSMPIRSAAQAAAGMNGGEGAQCVQAMTRCASDDNRIYIGVDVVGVWRSDNGGAFWRPCLMKGIRNFGTTAVAVNPAKRDQVLVYTASDWDKVRAKEEGLFRSTDGGDNWARVVPVLNNDGGNPSGRAVIAYSNASRVYFGAYTHGVYRSNDGGATWTGPLSLVGTRIERVAADPNNFNKVWAATDAGLQVSTDGGVSWRVIPAFAGADGLEVSPDPVVKDRVYYIKPGIGLQRSNDAGATWTSVPSGDAAIDARATRLYQSPTDSLNLTLASATADRVSTDGGISWRGVKVDTSKTYNAPVGWGQDTGISYSYANPGQVIGLMACTIYASSDAGKTYGDSATGFTGFHHGWGNNAVAFSTDPNRFAIFCYDTGLNLTMDGGSTWIHKPLAAQVDSWWGAYAGDMSPDWSKQPVVVEAAGNYFHADLMRSATGNTGAADWLNVSHTDNSHYFVRFNPNDASIAYADNQRSGDGGKTWVNLTETICGFAPSRPDTVYAYSGGLVKISTDRGTTWAALPAPPKPAAGRGIEVDPANPNNIWAITGPDISVFNGSSWKLIPVSSWATPTAHAFADRIVVDPTNGRRVIAGLNSFGESYLFLSENGGSTWSDITGDLPRLGANQSLNIQPVTGRIFIGMGFGTYTTFIGPPKGGDTQAPSVPTRLASAVKTTASVKLTWAASTDNIGIRAYDVYQGSTLVGTTASTSYTVMGLKPATAYTFTVKARDNAGNTASSRPLIVKTR